MNSHTLGDINPYTVRDGPWGGFGRATWFVIPSISARNVFEQDTFGKWKRVWDDNAKLWRDLNNEEMSFLLKLR